jgi:hypothetical protein
MFKLNITHIEQIAPNSYIVAFLHKNPYNSWTKKGFGLKIFFRVQTAV